ncbi:MAG: hypothetical protein E7257_11610 [Lachnospiraceae bacterium]|nr:hypothetical protein [Lachnospiraceae bacterium]MBQ9934906.1 hypothetical protein [Lachnospiraceae bacterium]
MAKIVELQKDMMKELADYSPKIILGTEEIVGELRGDRKKDTDELFNLVIQGINWEIEVFNNCESLINQDFKYIDKGKMATAVVRLGKVLQEKDDIKIAACLEVDFLPFLRSMEQASLSIV